MSYYFAIVGTQDNPLFEHEFGTSKQGGDGQPRFGDQARHLNQFVLHSSLDIAEESQWTTGQLYLKCIDKFFNSYISCFVTGANVKFLLLHQPTVPGGPGGAGGGAGGGGGGGPTSAVTSPTTLGSNPLSSSVSLPSVSAVTGASSRASTSIAANPTSPATEEAVRSFFAEVYENWVKATMSPFYRVNQEVRSPVFRARVAAAGRKYL